MNPRLRKGRGMNFYDAAKAKSLRDHCQPNENTVDNPLWYFAVWGQKIEGQLSGGMR